MAIKPTSTSSFGVSRREGHDASAFYSRFTPPALSSDSEIRPAGSLDRLIRADARSMAEVADSSVALVVTSPPYFVGKEYEAALGEGGGPSTYFEYLELLRDVFAECVRTLEPGGRIAVNVANLGRRPYRSLSGDVTRILQDDLRLLLRGEIIWLKQRGSSGSCAWGSFQRPGNPVLRDLTERVIVASKGRFDRAVPPQERAARKLPSEASMTREDFMENTLDVWEIPPESARRVGHPAPFPVDLPLRLIELYTYRGDLVLDPFAGAGTTAVAALRSGRHYVGYDLDEQYIELAEERVAGEARHLAGAAPAPHARVSLPGAGRRAHNGGGAVARGITEGWAAKEISRQLLVGAGFTGIEQDRRLPGGIEVTFSALDARGGLWYFEVAGGYTSHRPGLSRPETLWRTIGRAAVLQEVSKCPLVVLTAGLPPPRSPAAEVLKTVCGEGRPIREVIDCLASTAGERLGDLFDGGGRPVARGLDRQLALDVYGGVKDDEDAVLDVTPPPR
jgi:DNA modification methylase